MNATGAIVWTFLASLSFLITLGTIKVLNGLNENDSDFYEFADVPCELLYMILITFAFLLLYSVYRLVV